MVQLHWLFLLCGLFSTSTAQSASGSGVASGSGACPEGQFQCQDGSCIPESLVCDGFVDCTLAEDEMSCEETRCRPDQLRCTLDGTCVSLADVCDGIRNCLDGTDETACPPPPLGSRCNSTQFECPLSGTCIPRAWRCDGEVDCPQIEDEQMCQAAVVTQTPAASVSVVAGETITLTCVAEGSPPPFITWRKDLQPLLTDQRYTVTSEDGVGTLTIRGARVLDAGEYTCEVLSSLFGSFLVLPSTQVSVSDAQPATCVDHLNQEFLEGQTYYNVEAGTSGPARQAAADIIFVVDESGSMFLEHEWIRSEVVLLDVGLRERGVGVGDRENLFALVGFARDDPTAITGTVLSQLASPNDFVAASMQLSLNGLAEDGYAAIVFALDNIVTRADTAKQIILVTDEDRSVLRTDLTRDIVEERIREEGFVLNVVVNQGFLADPQNNRSFALGLSGDGTAYVFDPDSPDLFSSSDGGGVLPNLFFDTFTDYVELAFNVGGVGWDLNQLREQGLFAEAFSNAFTEVKVEEIMTVFRFCFTCFCTLPEPDCGLIESISIENCTGIVPEIAVRVTPSSTFIAPGGSVTFTCLADTNLPSATLDFTWSYPVQNNVVVADNVLTVTNVEQGSSGLYICVVRDLQTGIVASANGSLEVDNRCTLGDGTMLPFEEVRVVLSLPPSNVSQAADVILIVDESGSMFMEHQWIVNMTRRLDEALIDVSVGVSPRNRFGVVGFGADCVEEIGLGRIITSNSNTVFTFASNITEFTSMLDTSGRREDGYSGIKTALDGYEFRDVAKQFILITDEDRDVVQQNLTRETIQQMLVDEGIVLNAAVSEEFSGDGFRSLGIDSGGNAYVYDPSAQALYRVIRGGGMPIMDSAHGSTNMDYTQLALELSGAAWDLSQLRAGGRVAEAFTNAFVQVKVLEIRAQMQQCLNCSCGLDGAVCEVLPTANFSECILIRPPPPPQETPVSLSVDTEFARVLPAEERNFTCEANTTATLGWTFNGGHLPSNVVVNASTPGSSQLTIVGATEENTGVYACLGHTPSEAFNGAAFVEVEFYDPALDLMLELSPLHPSVTQGRDATFICSVPEPATFVWTFEDGPLPSNAVTFATPTLSTLMVLTVEESNTGAYTCLVNNSQRELVNEDTTYLTVVEPVLSLSVEPRIVEIQEGSVAQFVCSVTCFCPGVVPMWSRVSGDPLPDQAEVVISSDEVIQSGEGIQANLTIQNAQPEDEGQYVCSAQLDGRTAELLAVLSVAEDPPEFAVSISGSAQVMIGENHFLLCEANQNTSKIRWTFNGDRVPRQRQRNITEVSSGEYDSLITSGMEEDVADETGDSGSGLPLTELRNVVSVGVSVIRSVLAIQQAADVNSGNYQCMGISEDGEIASDAVDIVVGLFTESAAPTATIVRPTPPFTASPTPPAESPLQPPRTVAASPTPLAESPLQPPRTVTASPTPPTGSPLQPPRTVAASPTPAESPLQPPRTTPAMTRVTQFPTTTDTLGSPTPMPTMPPPPFTLMTSTRRLTLAEGENATILCQSNHPVLSLRWRFNSQDLPPNVDINMLNPMESQLTIRSVTTRNAGQYQCMATSALVPESLTAISAVIFQETLAIRVFPGSQVTVNQSESVQLSCTLDCECIGTQLSWQRQDGSPLHPSAMVSLSDSRRTVFLRFVSVPAEARGVYLCVATNDMLGEARAEVQLEVIGSTEPSTTPLEPPTTPTPTPIPTQTPSIPTMPEPPLSVTPSFVSLPEGAMTTFVCIATESVQSFEWTFNSNSLPSNAQPTTVSATTSQLVITDITQDNAGSYLCIATFDDGQIERASARIRFEDSLSIRVDPGPQVTVMEGERVQLICSLNCSCDGENSLEWRRADTQDLPESAMVTLSDSRRAVTLTFASATADVAGEYECEADRSDSLPVTSRVELRIGT